MAEPSPLPPPPSFKQKRAARTYDALLEAAGKVFAERGFEATQTPDIAAAAGVSTGALYRYFKDKRHLFLEMLRHHMAHAQAEVAARLDPGRFQTTDARATIEAILDVIFDLAQKNAPITRAFVAASLTDPDVARMRAELEAQDRAMVAQTIRTFVGPEVVPDAAAAALVIQITVFEVALERAGVRPAKGPRVADRDVKVALRDMICRYLQPSGPVPEPPVTKKRKVK